MTRSRRNRTRRPNGLESGSSAVHKQPSAQSNNMFANLSDAEQDDGEVNAHLTDRIGRASLREDSPAYTDHVPSAGSSVVNNDIRKYYELAQKPVKGGAWLDKPEVPDASEILPQERPSFSEPHTLVDVGQQIRSHRVEGAYESNEEYLGTKYELLREDFIRPFREMMDEFRKDPYKDEAEYSDRNIGIYDPVYITGLVFSPRGLATRIAFSLSRVKKFIRWQQSKRLITGSLVALSPVDDAFQNTCILATVAARPLTALEQNPPEIDLFFARPEEQEIDPMKKWVMIECRGSFFEASRHTLLALQHLMREPFPLAEHLVEVKKEVEPPNYIKYNPYMDLSSLVSMEDSADFENVNVLEDWPSSTSLSLDKSQSKALKRMLTSKVAIVQGPPGTGKTHVSGVMIKVQRDNLRRDDSPIIITAQTNHAVDQILRHTMEFEPNFIRLGGRSQDAEIKKRTLFEVRSSIQQKKQPSGPKAQATSAMRNLTAACQNMLLPLEAGKPPLDHRILLALGVISEEQADSLQFGLECKMDPELLMEQWLGRSIVPCHRPSQPDDYDWGFEEEDLEVEQLQELEAEAVAKDDDDIEALRGPVTPLSDNWDGRVGGELTLKKVPEILHKTSDLTMIQPQDRGIVYKFFKQEVKSRVVAKVRNIAQQYNQVVLQRKVALWEDDSRLLRQQRIIGCTTTGLSKYRALLTSVRPRVILVEEAAETMEAPVTAACLPTLEHLILVGDHQQLRPHTNVHAFEDEPYYLNLSLFERLVCNDVTYSTLIRQRRMIPEVRRLLAPIYEDTLKDHDSVKDLANRPPVEGMGGNNSFFFCHDWPEARDYNMSSFNEHEARMIVGFVDYLILNGVEPAKITVLTFYNGQRKFLLKALRQHQNSQAFGGIQVKTVDSYQGEENDIVILSLVRSNRERKIGFLSSENRACVALSRAKRGFYIFGNAELLACETRVWASVVEIMYKDTKVKVKTGQKRRIGYHLPVECLKHGRKEFIQTPDDWDLIHGGCLLKCDGMLPCQHPCPYRCHPFDHDQVNCMMQCNRPLSCGHVCVNTCSEACRCRKCESRGNGMRSMLKTGPNGMRSLNPAQHTGVRQNPEGTPEEWQKYIQGGAAVDDAQLLQKRREEEAEYLEAVRDTPNAASSSTPMPAMLVEVSSSKELASTNTDLLIDLDFGSFQPSPVAKPSYANTVSGKSRGKGKGKNEAKAKAKAEANMNLLD